MQTISIIRCVAPLVSIQQYHNKFTSVFLLTV